MSEEKDNASSGPAEELPKRLRHNRYVQYMVALGVLILGLWFIMATRSPEGETGGDKLAWIKKDARLMFPDVKRISTENLANWPKDDETPQPVLLDARAPEEFAISHLQDAILVTADADHALAVLEQKEISKETPLVVYCSVGWRSAQLARALNSAGYQFVWNLEGSIFQWANEGRPVYRDGQQVRDVHPYGSPWSWMLDEEYRTTVPRPDYVVVDPTAPTAQSTPNDSAMPGESAAPGEATSSDSPSASTNSDSP